MEKDNINEMEYKSYTNSKNNKEKKDYYSISELKFSNSISCIEYINNSKTFIVGDKLGKLYIWDIRTYKPCQIINTEINNKINHIKSNSDHELLFSQNKAINEVDLRLNIGKPILKSDKIINQLKFDNNDNNFIDVIDEIEEVRFYISSLIMILTIL